MVALPRRAFLGTAALATGSLPLAAALAAEKETLPPAKFKLGLVTYNLAAKWDRKTILDVCQKTGLAAVEFRTTHAHKVEPTLGKEERKEIRKQFADGGVQIWGCGTVCEFHGPDRAVIRKNIDTCQAFIDLVADLGGRGVKVRPNALPKEVPVEKTLETIGKALTECGKAAADAGVEIHVEVHGRGTAHPPHIKTIMDHCGHKSVGLTWNSNDTDIKNGSVAEYFKLLWPWIRSCHINRLHLDATGKYPYRELFHLFRAQGYDRVTLIELGQGMPDVASSIEFLHYYKALWKELVG